MSSSRPTLPEPEKQGRIKQFAETYRMARKSDPQLGLWIAGSFVVGALVGFGVFWLAAGHRSTLGMILTVVGAVMLGVLAALITFSRRAQKAAYAQMEGRSAPPPAPSSCSSGAGASTRRSPSTSSRTSCTA
jgi:F0F1-type ATP synthase assembly protein I